MTYFIFTVVTHFYKPVDVTVCIKFLLMLFDCGTVQIYLLHMSAASLRTTDVHLL